MISALVGGRWHLTLVFSCVSLLLTDAEDFFCACWLFLYLPRRKNFLWILRKLLAKFNKILINYSNRKKSSWTLFSVRITWGVEKKNPWYADCSQQITSGSFFKSSADGFNMQLVLRTRVLERSISDFTVSVNPLWIWFKYRFWSIKSGVGTEALYF